MIKFLSVLTGSALTVVALRTPSITAMIPTISFSKTDTISPNSIDDQVRLLSKTLNQLSTPTTDPIVQAMLVIGVLYNHFQG